MNGMNKDKILSALIGLAGACANNGKTENTDTLIIKALSAASAMPDCGEEEAELLTEEIHAERDAVSPGCASCIFPLRKYF